MDRGALGQAFCEALNFLRTKKLQLDGTGKAAPRGGFLASIFQEKEARLTDSIRVASSEADFLIGIMSLIKMSILPCI